MFHRSPLCRRTAYWLKACVVAHLLVVGGLPQLSSAQDSDARRMSVDLGFDVTSAYFFRGYNQEDRGAIVQPFAEVGFALVDGGDGSPSIDAAFGTWNSFHSAHTGAADNGADTWYESDIYAGFTFGFDSFELGVGYLFYTYPSSDFNTVQEIGITLGFDLPDDEWTGTWIGDVTLGFHFEVDNSNVGPDEAAYFQLDFGPSFEVFNGKATLSLPVTLGLSLDDYYVGTDDETFGFLSLGTELQVPLGSGEFGTSSFTIGVTTLILGDTTEASNNADDSEVLAYAGVSLSF